jgi:hypothetical protein
MANTINSTTSPHRGFDVAMQVDMNPRARTPAFRLGIDDGPVPAPRTVSDRSVRGRFADGASAGGIEALGALKDMPDGDVWLLFQQFMHLMRASMQQWRNEERQQYAALYQGRLDVATRTRDLQLAAADKQLAWSLAGAFIQALAGAAQLGFAVKAGGYSGVEGSIQAARINALGSGLGSIGSGAGSAAQAFGRYASETGNALAAFLQRKGEMLGLDQQRAYDAMQHKAEILRSIRELQQSLEVNMHEVLKSMARA